MAEGSKTPAEAAAPPPKRDDSDDDLGRPRAAGELDPELMRLPKRRTKIGWLLAVAVIAFCVYWMVALRDDLIYSRQGETPQSAELASLQGFSNEAFVSAELTPDRVQTARVWAGADLGVHAAPVLGAGGRVWLVTSGSAFAGEPRYDNRFVGRVKRLGDLPFYDKLVDYYARATPSLEVVAVDAVIAGLAAGATSVNSAHGDPINLSASTQVEVTWAPSGRAWIVVSPEADGPTNSMEWKTAIETRAGLSIRGEIENDSPSRVPTWTFEVDAPAGTAAIAAKLAAVGLSAARVVPVSQTAKATWADLTATGDLLTIGSRTGSSLSIGIADIGEVVVAKRVVPAPDAVVLIEGERPGDFWYLLPLYLLLAVFVFLFGWTLVKALRGSLPPTVVA